MENKNILEIYLQAVRTNHLIEKQFVCESTMKAYRDRLRLFFKYIGDKPLNTVLTKDVKGYLANCVENGIKPATLKVRLSAIKAMYKELSDPDHGLEIHDVANCIKPIRNKYEHKLPIAKADLARMAGSLTYMKKTSHLAMRDYLFFEFLRFYGLRVSSALNIKVSDIVLEYRGVRLNYVAKGNKECSKMMPTRSAEGKPMHAVLEFKRSLRKYIEKIGDGPIFLAKGGKPWTYAACHKSFKKLCTKCGFSKKGYTMHSIRHSFVSHKLAAGVPIQTVSALVDHSSTFITASIYSRAEDEDMDGDMAKGIV
jgi:site-specific recombinase XerD